MTADTVLQESESTGFQLRLQDKRRKKTLTVVGSTGAPFWERVWKGTDTAQGKDLLRQGLRIMEWLEEKGGGQNVCGVVADKFVGAMWGRMMVEERKAEAWKRERAAERVVGDVRSQSSLHRLIREIERVRKDRVGLYEWLGEVLVRSYS